MSVKLMVIYQTPEDPAKFDQYYEEIHVPLANKIPGLESLELNRVTKAMMGQKDIYLIAELVFADHAAFEKAAASQEFAATGKDLPNFAANKATLLLTQS